RRPELSRSGESRLEAELDADESPQPHGDRMCGARRIGIVVRELEAGDHEQAVADAGAHRFDLDVAEVLVVVAGADMPGATRGVVGDGEDVEAAAAVEIAELTNG